MIQMGDVTRGTRASADRVVIADGFVAIAVSDMTRPTRASGDRAVIVDDNEAISLAVYSSAQRRPLGVIELPPLVTARLAMR